MQPLAFLSFRKFRAALERRGCTCICLIPYGDMLDAHGVETPAVYSFERSISGELKFAVVHTFDQDEPVALSVIRSALAALDLDFDPSDSI